MSCKNKVRHQITWPGQPATYLCARHMFNVQAIAEINGVDIKARPAEDYEMEKEVCKVEVDTITKR